MMVKFLVQLQLTLVESTCWVFIRKEEFKSCFLHGWKLWCFSTRKQFKSCSHASCVCQQRSSLKVVVSMHHMFVTWEEVKKLRCMSIIMCLSTRKQFKSWDVYPSSGCQKRSGVIFVVAMHDLIISKEAVFKAAVSLYASCDRRKVIWWVTKYRSLPRKIKIQPKLLNKRIKRNN